MELKRSIICLNIFFFIFVSCFDSHQISNDNTLKLPVEYKIDKKFLKVRTFEFDNFKVSSSVDQLCDSGFLYKKFNLLSQIKLVKLNEHFLNPIVILIKILFL